MPRRSDHLRPWWRRCRCFVIIARCCRSARRSRTRCSRASSPKRCCLNIKSCLGDERIMADKIPAATAAGAQLARPGVLSLNIRERAALYAAYMPFLRGGGIFIPTSRPYTLGEEVFMLLSLMDDPNRIAVRGKGVWGAPESVQGNRTQRIGVHCRH